MADNDLLARVGAVLPILSMAGLSFDDRLSMAHRAELAEDFMALPDNDRRVILAVEKIVASGLTSDQLVTLFVQETLDQTQIT